jgi:uncharacterized protein
MTTAFATQIRNFKFGHVLLVVITVAVLQPLAPTAGAWGLADPVEPTITVSGDAEVRAIPDEVIITAGILTRAKTVSAASEENDAKVKALREFLKKQGIDDKYISTTYMQISPIERREKNQSYSKGMAQVQLPPNSNPINDPFSAAPDGSDELTVPQPVGYQVSRTYSITVSDVTKFEGIYKGIVNQGINMVSNVEFRTSQLRKYRDQARLMAVRAAREKATEMAEALGAKLASVRTIQEQGNTGYRYSNYQARSDDPFGASETSSEIPGQISITASVQVVFVLKEAEL